MTHKCLPTERVWNSVIFNQQMKNNPSLLHLHCEDKHLQDNLEIAMIIGSVFLLIIIQMDREGQAHASHILSGEKTWPLNIDLDYYRSLIATHTQFSCPDGTDV